MIKVVKTVTCDICGASCKDEFAVIKMWYKQDVVDVCSTCVNKLAQVSLKQGVVIPRRHCPDCKGKGYIKESVGYHNDYETKDCTACGKFK